MSKSQSADYMRRFREKNPDYRQKESEYHKNYYSERRKDPSFISAIREKNRQQYLKRKMKKMAAESESSSNPDHDSASTIRMEEGPEGEGSDKASPSRAEYRREYRKSHPEYKKRESDYHRQYYREKRKDPNFLEERRERNRKQYLKRKNKEVSTKDEDKSDACYRAAYMRQYRMFNPEYRQKASLYHKMYNQEKRKDPEYLRMRSERNRQQYLKRKQIQLMLESGEAANEMEALEMYEDQVRDGKIVAFSEGGDNDYQDQVEEEMVDGERPLDPEHREMVAVYEIQQEEIPQEVVVEEQVGDDHLILFEDEETGEEEAMLHEEEHVLISEQLVEDNVVENQIIIKKEEPADERDTTFFYCISSFDDLIEEESTEE